MRETNKFYSICSFIYESIVSTVSSFYFLRMIHTGKVLLMSFLSFSLYFSGNRSASKSGRYCNCHQICNDFSNPCVL